MPSNTDILILGVLAAVAFLPTLTAWLYKRAEGVQDLISIRLASHEDHDDLGSEKDYVAWKQKWNSSLITLLGELEETDYGSARSKDLCRELLWEVITGGEGSERKVKK